MKMEIKIKYLLFIAVIHLFMQFLAIFPTQLNFIEKNSI